MSEAIIVAVITGGLSLIGVLIANRRSSAELYARLDKQSELSDEKIKRDIAVVQTRIDELTREVRAHNDFAQRVPVIEEQIRVANHRIEDLERKGA